MQFVRLVHFKVKIHLIYWKWFFFNHFQQHLLECSLMRCFHCDIYSEFEKWTWSIWECARLFFKCSFILSILSYTLFPSFTLGLTVLIIFIRLIPCQLLQCRQIEKVNKNIMSFFWTSKTSLQKFMSLKMLNSCANHKWNGKRLINKFEALFSQPIVVQFFVCMSRRAIGIRFYVCAK